MTQLTLTTDQAALLSGSDSALLVCRPDGQVVGVLSKTGTATNVKGLFSADEIAAAEAERLGTSARRTTREVLDRLATLEAP